MELYLENGYTSLNKDGEELCGDNVEMRVQDDYTTLVLADGLGSGVKANILATLTSKILCTMISGGIDLDECISTIIQTLPVCKVRNVAYATFSVIYVNKEGEGYLLNLTIRTRYIIRKGNAGILNANLRFITEKRST